MVGVIPGVTRNRTHRHSGLDPESLWGDPESEFRMTPFSPGCRPFVQDDNGWCHSGPDPESLL